MANIGQFLLHLTFINDVLLFPSSKQQGLYSNMFLILWGGDKAQRDKKETLSICFGLFIGPQTGLNRGRQPVCN